MRLGAPWNSSCAIAIAIASVLAFGSAEAQSALRTDPVTKVQFLATDSGMLSLPKGRQGQTFHLYMNVAGLPLFAGLPTDLTNNDVIRIYVVGKPLEVESLVVTVSGTLEGDAFAVQGAEARAPAKQAKDLRAADTSTTSEEPVAVDMGTYGPFAAPSVTIEVKRKVPGKEELLRNYKLKVTQTYLASVGVGFGRSSVRFHQFEARVPKDSTAARIHDRSDNHEVRSYVLVTFYGWRFWEKGGWKGRDPNRAPGVLERINPFVGVGLEDVGKEYAVGASVTLARGLELAVGGHLAKVPVLALGYREGDLFAGPSDQIPTRERWESQSFVAITMDVRVATQVLGIGK
jgi:hypothetical protein